MAHDLEPLSQDGVLLAYAAPQAEASPLVFGGRAFFDRAVFACMLCIGAAGALDGIAYFASYHDRIHMDWPVTGALFALFILTEGFALGAGASGGILAADALVARSAPSAPRRPLASGLGAMIGGALATLLPSALGTLYFGSKTAPFVGTVAIAVVPVAGVLAASTMIAAADARMRGATARWTTLLAYAFAAVIPLALAGATIASSSIDAVPRWAWELLDPRGGAVAYAAGLSAFGAIVGATLGASLGLHIGVTTALARWRSIA